MLTLAVACTDELYGPEETPATPDKASGIEITVANVTDNSFQVTVTPAGESAYYSWLVDESATAVELDAETLYKVGYKSVTQGTAKWTAEATSKTFTVNDLKPNTTYQIYAVAGSEMGFAGTVAVKDVKTTDTVAPGYKSYTTEENQVVFAFSEAVTATDLAASIKVAYYAPYSAAFKTAATPAGEVTVPADSITVVGTEAAISVPGLPTGSLWTISIPEGAFVDAVGQKLPGYTSSYVMAEDSKGNLAPAPKGFYGEVSYVELPMLGDMDLAAFTEWDGGFLIPLENEYALAGFSSKKFITVTYEAVADNSVETIVYTLTPEADYNVTSLGLVVNLPAEPMCLGADVTISIPAGTLYDVFGNDCEAWEHTMKYSYGYTLEDVTGNYLIKEASGLYGSYFTTGMVIAKSDKAEKGNVMFTVYDDFECEVSPIYATFDVDAGTLTVPSLQVFGKYEDYYTVFVSCSVSSTGSVGIAKDPVVFNVNSPNVITGPNTYYGVALADSTGSIVDLYDVYMVGYTTAKLAPAEATSTSAKVAHSTVFPLNSVVKF